MRERFGAQDERSWRLRFHTQTGGVTLTAQQPENNIVRVALQGFAAVCGGTQSLHTNGFDEALALPTERAAKIALRTQQIIGYESGAADTVDPFAGSYFVEALTDEIERRAQRADRQGRRARRLGAGDRVHQERDRGVGVRLPRALPASSRTSSSASTSSSRTTPEVPDLLRVDPESEREQVARLKAFKADRDQELVAQRLDEVRDCARGTGNMLPVLRQALKDRCSIGEVCGAMRDVFGATSRPTDAIRLRCQPAGRRHGLGRVRTLCPERPRAIRRCAGGLRCPAAKDLAMSEHEAARTLVKSLPELWMACSEESSLARHLDHSARSGSRGSNPRPP